MELEPDETCCVCYEVMDSQQNLTFCKVGCGKNIHTECMERWVRHKIQNHQSISCPLCRTRWGENALDELRLITQKYRNKQIQDRLEESKNQRVNRIKNHSSISQAKFTCRSCLRLVPLKDAEQKFQCLICPNIQICNLCFKGSFHNNHKFISRRSDTYWEPAPRNGENEDYKKLSQEL